MRFQQQRQQQQLPAVGAGTRGMCAHSFIWLFKAACVEPPLRVVWELGRWLAAQWIW